MEARSKKIRSLAVENKTVNPPKRPPLGDRHNSAPAVNRRSDVQNKRASANIKASEGSRRNSKASARDETETRHSVANIHRLSERSRSSPRASRRSSRHTIDLDDLTTFNFIVLGAKDVGKSVFIRNALDLRKPLTTPFASSKVSLAGNIYRVQLLELLFDDVDLTHGEQLIWPKYINNIPLPTIDGVFCLYDVTEQESLNSVPQILSALSTSEIPHMLVASKAETPDDEREVLEQFHNQIQRCYKDVVISEVSIDLPESPKRCILSILRKILAISRESSRYPSRSQSRSRVRRSVRQYSSYNTSPATSRSRSRSHSHVRHSKSQDYMSSFVAVPPLLGLGNEASTRSDQDIRSPYSRAQLKVNTDGAARQSLRPTEPQTPESSDDQSATRLVSSLEPSKPTVPETPESYYARSVLRNSIADSADSRAIQTFLNMDEESYDDGSHTDVPHIEPVVQNVEEEEAEEVEVPEDVEEDVQDQIDPQRDSGPTFRHLVEKLLTLPTSKQDSKFVPSFLCLYRCFATPQQLVTAIVEKFVSTQQSDLGNFTKVAEQLRYLQVLGQWTAQYPGDFASTSTREIAMTFVEGLERSKLFEHAAREVINNLSVRVEDEDLDWAYDGTATAGTRSAFSSSSKLHSTMSLASDASPTKGMMTKSSSAPATATRTPRTANSSQCEQNQQQLRFAVERAKRFRPNPHIRICKIQWHQFMDTPVEELAREITRIDWSMYSAIRPRDYVRHVTLGDTKRRLRQTDNISEMVRQFNHLALFVSGMILLRDKPKHRAAALEKFMALAWKVRQLNNYNSLGAIVAGITGHEIARLTYTRDLVPPAAQKSFLRLTILMGTSRSHAAYRLAWENSSQERIPFIPLLRQDLTMAATANSTFLGKSINWKKFEIMGDVIVGVQRSLDMPYTFPTRSTNVEQIIKLLLETKVIEEPEDSEDPRSELYDRSIQVEPQLSVDAKKKFEWLRR